MAAEFRALRAVLFDLDGTLIETHIDFPAMTRAMTHLALEAAVPESVIAGKDILGIVAAAAENLTARGEDGAALRRTAFAQLQAMEVAGCAHPELLPGTRELLASLTQRGLKVGIVTRNCRRVSHELLTRFDLPHNVLLTRDDVARTKPHPEHLWEALGLMEEAPETAAMVGDHWMDIQAGQQAGCAVTVGVLGSHSADRFTPCPPTTTVRDLSEALPLFG